MEKFLLYIGEGRTFDLRLAQYAIEAIEGVSGSQSGNFIGATFECTYYPPNGSSVIVRISETGETVTIDGVEGDAFKFAIEMQKRYPESLRLIDMNYTFDIDVSNYVSDLDLIEAVKACRNLSD